MSDLISRKKIRDYIKGEINTYGKPFEGTAYELGLKIMRYIDAMDSDYDVGKVVEKLEEIKGSACDGKSCSECEYTSDCLEGEQSEKVAIDKAIEIVKQGGVETETETIRDKAVKWNNNSSKRVPYEFIDYVEGKRELCVSDDVCEWKVKSNYYVTECSHDTDVMYGLKQDFKFCPYCGKKIKVVE